MRMMSVALAAVAATVVASTAAGIAPDAVVQLSSPTGKIGCVATNMDGPFVLRCDVANPTYTRPARPTWCPPDYGEFGDSFTLTARRRATYTCHGDTALRAGQPGFTTLRYGRTWAWGPFRCTMRTTGITCRNTAGHGFQLSRQRAVRIG